MAIAPIDAECSRPFMKVNSWGLKNCLFQDAESFGNPWSLAKNPAKRRYVNAGPALMSHNLWVTGGGG